MNFDPNQPTPDPDALLEFYQSGGNSAPTCALLTPAINEKLRAMASGGVFGWHQHGGPLWVIVQSGSLTFYEADDPSCTGKVYPAGSTFMDPGNHVHNARNEGSVDLVIYAVFMLPEGGATRLCAPHSGTCPVGG